MGPIGLQTLVGRDPIPQLSTPCHGPGRTEPPDRSATPLFGIDQQRTVGIAGGTTYDTLLPEFVE